MVAKCIYERKCFLNFNLIFLNKEEVKLIYLLSFWHALFSSGSAKAGWSLWAAATSLTPHCRLQVTICTPIWISILSAHNFLVKQEQKELKKPSWCMPLEHLEEDLSPLLTRKVFYSFFLSSEILCKYSKLVDIEDVH